MDKALIYWLYIIYPTAVCSLSAGCADTHTQRRYVPLGCSQNLIINGTLLFQLALLGQRGFHWIHKERKRLVQPTVHPQNTSCNICIHFPSFDPKTIFWLFLSLQGKVWMSTFWRESPTLLYSLHQLIGFGLHGAISSKLLVKSRECTSCVWAHSND